MATYSTKLTLLHHNSNILVINILSLRQSIESPYFYKQRKNNIAINNSVFAVIFETLEGEHYTN